ncbi:phosphoribosyltransferase [Nanoarchaeota archaeon]
MEKEKVYLSWVDFDSALKKLIEKIKESGKIYCGVYGIPRGGLVLAVCMAHALDLPLLMAPTKECLVVDDISDTGNALAGISNKDIACIYSTSWTKSPPTFHILEKQNQDQWIVFPWEV